MNLPPTPPPTTPQFSPDGLFWWDGFRWVPSRQQPQYPQHQIALPTVMLLPGSGSNAGLWWGAGGAGCLGSILCLTVVLFFPGLFFLALALALAVAAAVRR